jgi:hypothetical protein
MGLRISGALFSRPIVALIIVLTLFPVPALAVREKYYTLLYLGLGPLTITSKGFTDTAFCATIMNTSSQAVVSVRLEAFNDDARVKPAGNVIKRRIEPGMATTQNCLSVQISDITNVLVGRIAQVTFADGTIIDAPALPPDQPIRRAGTMTAADGSSAPALMPIEVSVCQAALGQYDLKAYFGFLDITYKNDFDVAMVRLELELSLASGKHTFAEVGSFAPGVTITHKLRATPDIGKNEVRTARIPCNITKIEMADGHVWTPATVSDR